MNPQLTAPQALRLIAAKIVNERKIETGLCWELDKLGTTWLGTGQLDYIEHRRAKAAIREHTDDDTAFLAPQGTHIKERAMFALLLAEQLEDEARGVA